MSHKNEQSKATFITMVLKNSKWDKKAKKKYLKKHGLNVKRQEEDYSQRPKWSSKKSVPKTNSTERNFVDSDSDSEWDEEEDETLLRQYFPQINNKDLTREQKIKIKKQLVEELIKEQDINSQQKVNESDEDGIYLGSLENKNADLGIDVPTKRELGDFLDLNREINKTNKEDSHETNILSDYGIDSHLDIGKKNLEDYNLLHYAKQRNRKLDEIPLGDLEGFKVGESVLGRKKVENEKETSRVRSLTQDEQRKESQRRERAKEHEFYNSMRKKFGQHDDNRGKNKVLEINNLNSGDEALMRTLNTRIVNQRNDNIDSYEEKDLAEDIDLLLGKVEINDTDSMQKDHSQNSDLKVDDFIKEITERNKSLSLEDQKEVPGVSESSSKVGMKAPNIDDDFLNDLLG